MVPNVQAPAAAVTTIQASAPAGESLAAVLPSAPQARPIPAPLAQPNRHFRRAYASIVRRARKRR